jgi:methylenetetrahydrofolate reductase (NADPH)
LALRGDPPRGQEYWVAADDRFQHATDLVTYIRERHGDAFCIGVAGYPESHPDTHTTGSKDEEYGHLIAKQAAGANFIVTQLFYDVEAFLSWYRNCRKHGITLPILPGIMPIQNYQSFRRMTSLCKTSVPQDVWDRLEPNRNDDAAIKAFGVEHAAYMIRRIQAETDIRGFHICTLNLENSVKRLLANLGWLEGSHDLRAPNDKLLDEKVPNAPAEFKTSASKVLPSTAASAQPTWTINGVNSTAIQDTTSWDEFPNGRYGDARSPAFGEMDGYGVSLKVPPADALKLWGYPVTESDLTAMFVNYLQGTLSGIPWCDCPILNETKGIQKELLALNSQGWWTVASQPSVDGVESTDPTFGFGPRLGYIFQKSFIEFFLAEKDMIELESRIKVANETKGAWLSYFAGNRRGDLRTNVSKEQGQSCAVTWGCFVGKEIVQSTIIEEESFKAWRDEAFGIWSEWELLFPLTSPTRKLLHSVGEQRWLVTVIHHDYKRGHALWDFLHPI